MRKFRSSVKDYQTDLGHTEFEMPCLSTRQANICLLSYQPEIVLFAPQLTWNLCKIVLISDCSAVKLSFP